MGLLRAAPLFRSLDSYILRMHANKLTLILISLVEFAQRVEPLIRQDACAWGLYFHEDIFIQSHHWRQLARQVMNLLKLLGLPDEDELETTEGSCPLPCPDVWPDQIALRNAMQRAADIYRCYARPAASCPWLPPM